MCTSWKLAIIGVLAAMLVWGVVSTLYPGVEFDPGVWQADAATGSGPRLRMADRMIARRALEGLSRTELIAKLGPPDSHIFPGYDMIYLLGPERGFVSIDSEWLAVQFGADGRVTGARLVRD